MALQKKKYRSSTNRSRGGGMTKMSRAPFKKDYSKNIRSHHGAAVDEVSSALSKQIARRKKYG